MGAGDFGLVGNFAGASEESSGAGRFVACALDLMAVLETTFGLGAGNLARNCFTSSFEYPITPMMVIAVAKLMLALILSFRVLMPGPSGPSVG